MRALILALILMVGAIPLHALDAPVGPPVLTVGGEIRITNSGALAVFDRAMLQALDWQEIETFTPFTDGPQRFSGPTLVSLLDLLGVEDGTLRATALSDYRIEIPVAHAQEYGLLLAMEQDGQPMRVRDNGPLWVIYPLTEAEAAQKLFDNKMIWQLVHIDVLE